MTSRWGRAPAVAERPRHDATTLRRLWDTTAVRYLLTAGAALAVAIATTQLPWSVRGVGYRVSYHVVAAVGFAMVVSGCWRDRAKLRSVAVLVVGAVGLQFFGDVGSTFRILGGEDRSWPYWTDPIFLTSYVTLMVAVVLTVQRREGRHDAAALLDAAIITTGCGVLVYAFLISETAIEEDVSVLGRAVGVAYLVCDVLVIGVVVRLLVTRAGRRGPPVLLAAALGCLLAGDVLFATTVLHTGDGPYVRWVDAAYLAFYPMFGVAMWHPDRSGRVGTDPGSVERLGRGRLVALAFGALLAPLTLLIEDYVGRDAHVRGVAFGAAVVFLLVLVRMTRLVRAVEVKSAQLEVLSRTDALTGLPNRRTFDHELERSVTAADSDFLRPGLSVAMIDLDRFKSFNDVNGHAAGDALLVGAAHAWAAHLSFLAPAATIARYGGEEFAVVLPGADEVAAARVLHELLSLTPEGQSFSAGVAQWDAGEEAAVLLARADLRLYEAKAAGRAQVVGKRTSTMSAVVAGPVS